MINGCTLVFDVGKTHVKATVLDSKGEPLDRRHRTNLLDKTSLYKCFDIDRIWDWFVRETRSLAGRYEICAISIATHGACAAIVDLETEDLVLPVLDYEFPDYPDFSPTYESLRPPFSKTYSPKLPAGLNLGRQLHWQFQLMSDAQRKKATVLLYPNFWAWKISGIAASDICSIGCHTDLWEPERKELSALGRSLGLKASLPPFEKSWEPLGQVSNNFANVTGVPADCLVMPGIHDSNASYVPYLMTTPEDRPAVVSTGTWVVAMSAQTPLAILREDQDMLANVDANGHALATARYMGGREFEAICELTQCDVASDVTAKDIADLIQEQTMALPCFAPGAGPFAQAQGQITGQRSHGKALATVYSALMVDCLLSNLNHTGAVVIEGSFAKNDLLCSLLATLRPSQAIYRHPRDGGVVDGCYQLANWHHRKRASNNPRIHPISVDGLHVYAEAWRKTVMSA